MHVYDHSQFARQYWTGYCIYFTGLPPEAAGGGCWMVKKVFHRTLIALLALSACARPAGLVAASTSASPATAPKSGILWREPGDISSRNLFYGRGGEKDQP